MASSSSTRQVKDGWQQLQGFVRDYAGGVSARDFRRLFDRDAVRAYEVLTRDQSVGPGPADAFKRWLWRIRLVFLGLSYKLTPARRVLFAAALLCAVLGVLELTPLRFHYRSETTAVVFDGSPLWYLVSIGLLGYLLALELVDRVRVRDELEVARELQAHLLPGEPPDLPGWRFACSYRTANEVGGDYYDFTHLEDGRLAIVVGDASGHGMAAGLVMAIADATLATAMDLDPSPVRVLDLLNRTLCRTGDRRTFMSLFYALLTPETGRLEYVCAGHPYPVLRHAGGEVVELGCGALPLGLRGTVDYEPGEVTLGPSDALLLFTDGLVEATNRSGEAFGFDRLLRIVATGGTAQAIQDRLRTAFDEHVGDEPLRDDLTLVAMARLPLGPPPPPPLRPS